MTEVNDVDKTEKVLYDASETLVKTFSNNLNADYVMTYVCNEYVNKDKSSRKFKQIDKLSKLATSSKLQDARNSMKAEVKKEVKTIEAKSDVKAEEKKTEEKKTEEKKEVKTSELKEVSKADEKKLQDALLKALVEKKRQSFISNLTEQEQATRIKDFRDSDVKFKKLSKQIIITALAVRDAKAEMKYDALEKK